MLAWMLIAIVATSALIPAAHAFAVNPAAAGLLRRGHAAAAIDRMEALRTGLRAPACHADASAASARRSLHLMMTEGMGARARERVLVLQRARARTEALALAQRAGADEVLLAGSAKPKLVGLIGATGGVGRLCAAALQEQVPVRCMRVCAKESSRI